jgi:hypothetical protein
MVIGHALPSIGNLELRTVLPMRILQLCRTARFHLRKRCSGQKIASPPRAFGALFLRFNASTGEFGGKSKFKQSLKPPFHSVESAKRGGPFKGRRSR